VSGEFLIIIHIKKNFTGKLFKNSTVIVGMKLFLKFPKKQKPDIAISGYKRAAL